MLEISFTGEVYTDKCTGMGTGMMHLLICYIHLFYFSVYQAGFSHPHKLLSDPRKCLVSVFSLLELGYQAR